MLDALLRRDGTVGSGPKPLGRRTPESFEHVERYPLSALPISTIDKAERTLRLPWWHWQHDQGYEGSCVGHAVAMERAITNSAQNVLVRVVRPTRRYDPIHVWNEAKKIDVWPDTNPGDSNGTSVSAAYDVVRTQGVCRVKKMVLDARGNPTPVGSYGLDPAEGISTNRWATTVDEMRTAVALGTPVVIGVDWYSGFDTPVKRKNEWWLPSLHEPLGSIRGGHAVCVYAVSDRRQAFKFKNSWGRDYPLAWLPFDTMERLLHDYGEAALVTDR